VDAILIQTMKIKRWVILEKFKDRIEVLSA